MRVLQVNTYDLGGGAEAVCRSLHLSYRSLGADAYLAVGRRYGDDPGVAQIERYPEAERRAGNGTVMTRVSRLAHRAVSPHAYLNAYMRRSGRDVLRYPSSRTVANGLAPDVIQCHNLHGHYFDLRALPELARRAPVVLTLHDCWLLGGHCAHSFGCERWRTGCGDCPDLSVPKAIRRDATATNWADRRSVFLRFRYRVSTPCQWLMDKVEESLLADNMLEGKVIANGVDLRTFRPGDREEARRRLGLDPHAKVILHVGAYARTSWWRDYGLLEEALASADEDVTLLCVGEDGERRRRGRLSVEFLPPINDPSRLADLYRAADVYAHPAKQDTFPMAVLEALACGTPVVATSVGGIPEQVDDTRTGLLVPADDVEAMGDRLTRLLDDESARERMGRQAARTVEERFDLAKQASAYLAWFQQFAGRR